MRTPSAVQTPDAVYFLTCINVLLLKSNTYIILIHVSHNVNFVIKVGFKWSVSHDYSLNSILDDVLIHNRKRTFGITRMFTCSDTDSE